MYRAFALAFVLLFSSVQAIPIDNGVEGEPEIECGPTGITVSFNTRNPFEGRVYVKGLFSDPACRNEQTGGRVASIVLPFDTCGVARTRSLNPAGLFVGTTVVISFHPRFETKVDRAYRVQCFYMEADKTVTQELEVSMLTTLFQTQLVPMPVCRYDILDGGPDGQPIRYAIVGQQVYHKWTCDTETVDTFCARVHSCFVDDGAGDRVDLLNIDGCAIDRFLLRNLEYLTDLMAGQEAHVFKYADRSGLFFNCQIAITIKEPGQQCVRPECPEPGGPTGGAAGGVISAPAPAVPAPAVPAPAAETPAPAPAFAETPAPAPADVAAPAEDASLFRNRRQARESSEQDIGTVDVIADMQALDIDEDDSAVPSDLIHRTRKPDFSLTAPGQNRNGDFCLSTTGFGLLIAVIACVFLTAVVTSATFCFRRSKE